MTHQQIKRLQFRAWHRGFLEADLVLGRFADAKLSQMSNEDLRIFDKVLSIPDAYLYGWAIGEKLPKSFSFPEFNEEDGQIPEWLEPLRTQSLAGEDKVTNTAQQDNADEDLKKDLEKMRDLILRIRDFQFFTTIKNHEKLES